MNRSHSTALTPPSSQREAVVLATLGQKLAAEGLGTAFLLAIVVGSGLMAERLFAGQTGLMLLANALATAAGLYALIASLAPVSGAHFNPVVTLWAAMSRQLVWGHALLYGLVQLVGALIGVIIAHLMFDQPVISDASQSRTGLAQWCSEGVATFGLLWVIISTQQRNRGATPAVVAAYIGSAYWFTASTSFANPAVTLARSLTDSFAGIAVRDVGGFVVAQGTGAILAVLTAQVLLRGRDAPKVPNPAAAGAADIPSPPRCPCASGPAGSGP